jgi:hypothetical protein
VGVGAETGGGYKTRVINLGQNVSVTKKKIAGTKMF